jgi:hypothetical protein
LLTGTTDAGLQRLVPIFENLVFPKLDLPENFSDIPIIDIYDVPKKEPSGMV